MQSIKATVKLVPWRQLSESGFAPKQKSVVMPRWSWTLLKTYFARNLILLEFNMNSAV